MNEIVAANPIWFGHVRNEQSADREIQLLSELAEEGDNRPITGFCQAPIQATPNRSLSCSRQW